jgi:hypothetical protein
MKKWFLIGLILVSCKSTKFAVNFSLLNKPITYEKTKIAIASKTFGNITLSGYISIIQDSILCFKFYGPFSMDVVSGVYSDRFKVRDNYNKILYTDFDQHIYSISGLFINKKIIESLLLGKVSDLQKEILKVNSENFTINNSGGRTIILSNTSGDKIYRIEYTLKNQLPSSVLISYKDTFTSWSANIQNFYISNLTKKCNFGF